jgi:hypothetical protein
MGSRKSWRGSSGSFQPWSATWIWPPMLARLAWNRPENGIQAGSVRLDWLPSFNESVTQVISNGSEPITVTLYRLVADLPRHRFPLPRAVMPSNGIYLIFEEGELVPFGERTTDRIVRVGTHTSDGRLARRLRGHVSGNRRASVFRTHLGAALLARDDPGDERLETWIHQRRTRMPETEATVSDYVRQSLSVACIPVPTREGRLWLERGLIALLATSSLAQPSSTWLGHYSYHPAVRQSGLWNSQHVGAEPLTDADLASIQQLLAPSPT